jgi:hypothetical protein
MSVQWGKIRVSALVLVALTGSWLAFQRPPAAQAGSTCPGKNGRIAVTENTGGDGQAVSLVSRQGKVHPLVGPFGIEFADVFGPSFSCDGRRVVYGVDNQALCDSVEVAAVPSGHRINGPNFPEQPFATPHLCPSNPAFVQSGQIVFDARAEEGLRPSGTYIADRDGSIHLLFPSYYESVSADGRWFVVHAKHRLAVWGVDGRHYSITSRENDEFHYWGASISAGGKWIAYARVHIRPKKPKGQRGYDIFLVRRDGTHRRRMTFGGISYSPTFSPDGKEIAYMRRIHFESPEFVHNLAIMRVDKPGSFKLLTHFTGSDSKLIYDPAWSPR